MQIGLLTIYLYKKEKEVPEMLCRLTEPLF